MIGKFDIASYGAIPNSVADAASNLIAITNAILAAYGSGFPSIVSFGPGYWYVAGALPIFNNISYVGSGVNATSIINTTPDTPIFWNIGPATLDVTFSDMTLNRNVMPTYLGGSGLIFDNATTLANAYFTNLHILNQWSGFAGSRFNGARMVSVTIEHSYGNGMTIYGSNGQFVDLSILKSAGHGLVLLASPGAPVGGSFSNCTIWDTGDSNFDGIPDVPNKDCVILQDNGGPVGLMMNQIVLDSPSRHALSLIDTTDVALNMLSVTGGGHLGQFSAIDITTTKNMMCRVTAGMLHIVGSYSEGIFTNARMLLTVSGSLFLQSGTPNSTGLHFDNPTDRSGPGNFSVSGCSISKAGNGSGILIEKSGMNIGVNRDLVTGDGSLTVSGNACNNTDVEMVTIAPTYTGGYDIIGNRRTIGRSTSVY